MKTRIYVVTVLDGGESLVRARSRNMAVSHVAARTVNARVASQDDLVELAGKGVKVENAGVPAASETS